jgi:hypothetical protein
VDAGADADLSEVASTDGAGLETSVDAAADASREATAPAALALDKAFFIFGPTLFFCESEMPAVLTVTNVGGSDSAELVVRLEGAFADRFRVEKDACAGKPLAAGASCVVQLRFVPKVAMDEPATARLVVSGAAGESASSALSGYTNETPVDVFPFMSGFLDFGTVKVGSTSAILEDSWTNNTDFPATPGVPMLMGMDAADFAIAVDTCSGKTIAAHRSCQIGVQMKPAAPGQRFASAAMTGTGACGYEFGDSLTLVGVAE